MGVRKPQQKPLSSQEKEQQHLVAEMETLQEEVSQGPVPSPASSQSYPQCLRHPQQPVEQTPFSLVRETPGSQDVNVPEGRITACENWHSCSEDRVRGGLPGSPLCASVSSPVKMGKIIESPSGSCVRFEQGILVKPWTQRGKCSVKASVVHMLVVFLWWKEHRP